MHQNKNINKKINNKIMTFKIFKIIEISRIKQNHSKIWRLNFLNTKSIWKIYSNLKKL